MSREVEHLNRHLLRARDAMDRAYAQPLDVRAIAAVAHISPAHCRWRPTKIFQSADGVRVELPLEPVRALETTPIVDD